MPEKAPRYSKRRAKKAKMSIDILVKDKKYGGKYVAFRDFKDRKIVSYGKKVKDVYDKAVKKGFSNPVILYVPPKNTTFCF